MRSNLHGLAKAQAKIARQRVIIEELAKDGRDTRQAMELFANLIADALRFDVLRELTGPVASETGLRKSRNHGRIRARPGRC